MSDDRIRIRRALASVTDKSGLSDFVKELKDFGVEVVTTGGTARAIREAGYEVTEVSAVTGFPEIMDGRVKTLHPKIFGGILCDLDNKSHLVEANEHDIPLVQLVVVNFYAFQKVVDTPGITREQIIEAIDIGGPSLVRAAAKNYEHVAVATMPSQYPLIMRDMESNGVDGGTSLKLRKYLATQAFTVVLEYDRAINAWFSRH